MSRQDQAATYEYVGSELDLFSTAIHWKTYLGKILAPHVRGRVLEVGAGIGSNTPFLYAPGVTEWVSLEPDAALSARISSRISQGGLPKSCHVLTGDLAAIEAAPAYDTILYIDVLEHIADDRAELAAAALRLRPNGRLVVLAPAHQFLFSPFDAAIGHHRRYGAAALRRLGPPGCRMTACRMLDSVGFFASLANRVLLRSAAPSPKQIAFWDGVLVPMSRLVDPCIFYGFGKSILAVWTRD